MSKERHIEELSIGSHPWYAALPMSQPVAQSTLRPQSGPLSTAASPTLSSQNTSATLKFIRSKSNDKRIAATSRDLSPGELDFSALRLTQKRLPSGSFPSLCIHCTRHHLWRASRSPHPASPLSQLLGHLTLALLSLLGHLTPALLSLLAFHLMQLLLADVITPHGPDALLASLTVKFHLSVCAALHPSQSCA